MKTALSIMAIVLLVCSPNLWEVEAISGGIPNIGEMTFNEVTKNLAKLDIGSAVQQDTATILDDPIVINHRTWVQRWELGEPNPGGIPPAGWYDVAGWPGFDTFQINVKWSGDDMYFQIFTDFPETGYLDGSCCGYSHGGLYQLADLVFDLDLDGTWETGIALIDHGAIPADPGNPNPPGYGLPADDFVKGNIYSFCAWFSPEDIHYYHPGYAGRYDLDAPKIPPPAWMRIGTQIGEAEITWTDLGTTQPTYRIDVVLKAINSSGEWDAFGLLWGTGNCDNDVIEGTVQMTGRTIYIALDGLCNGNTPCFSQIQNGIDWKGELFTIKAEEGIYDEDIVLDEAKKITLEGGWDSTFTSLSGSTRIKSLTIHEAGTLEFDGSVVMTD